MVKAFSQLDIYDFVIQSEQQTCLKYFLFEDTRSIELILHMKHSWDRFKTEFLERFVKTIYSYLF